MHVRYDIRHPFPVSARAHVRRRLEKLRHLASARLTRMVLVSLCWAVVMLGWARCSSIPVADMRGSPCWTGHCSIRSHVDMSTSELAFSSWCCCYNGQGSVTSDVNTLPTHCITNGQGSAAARNNIGQLMSTLLHYSQLKLLHSGDIQPNPGPVNPEDTPLYWPVAKGAHDRSVECSKPIQYYKKIEQIRHVLNARGNNIHILGISETWLKNCHTNCEILAIQGYSIERHNRAEGNGGGVAVYIHESVSYKDIALKDTIGLRAMEVELRYTSMRVYHTRI